MNHEARKKKDSPAPFSYEGPATFYYDEGYDDHVALGEDPWRDIDLSDAVREHFGIPSPDLGSTVKPQTRRVRITVELLEEL